MEEIVKAEQDVSFPSYFAATNSEQMAKAQGGLTVWAESRLTQSRMDRMELERAVANARANKWATKVLESQLIRAKRLELYYGKLLAALSAGFVLVPAFPIDVFAIRTTKPVPRKRENVVKHGDDRNSLSTVKSECPPIGEGKYVSEDARRMEQYEDTRDVKGYNEKIEKKDFYRYWNEEFQDITFPMIACKPEVMSAAAQAMTLKLFDEIGVVTDTSGAWSARARRGDPLIIGAIYGPGPDWSRKKAHFLISWHINLEDL